MTKLGVARALIGRRFVDGDVEVDGGRVVAIGRSPAGRGTAAPGFIDLQVNGFAGVDLVTAAADGYRTAGGALAATGVTGYQPTFITGDPDVTCEALARLATVMAADSGGPRVLGAHLEGPFLSPQRAGTHPTEWLTAPDPALIGRYLDAGPVRTVTLAPELPGGLDAVDQLVAAGVVVCCGHTDADAATANEAFDRGARSVTHLFNAMRPFSHRDPGVAAVALTRADVAVPMIVDGIHLASQAVQLAWSAAGDRVVLVTDATAAAGMPDGAFRLGDVTVEKVGLEVRRGDGTLAGSALTMDAAVRNAVDLGVDLAAALYAASTAPAATLGMAPLGTLDVGTPADIVVLDDDLAVTRVLRGREEIA